MPKGKETRGPAGRAVTSEERDLLEGHGADLYEYAVAKGAIAEADQRIAKDSPERPGFELLLKLGLLNHDAREQVYLPVDPSIISSQVVAPMTHQGASLLAESSEWATTFNSLALSWRRAPGTRQGPFTEILGRNRINEFLEAVINDAQSELLTAQPQAGRKGLPSPLVDRDFRALERGVKMRTLYQHAARRLTSNRVYVAEITARGGEVRTLDEFFNRMVVVDREVAFVPGQDGPEVALAIREPSVVAYLVDVFDRAWERARPFVTQEATILRGVAAEQREMTIRMLKEGHSDPSAAKRLGVSPRTYAGYVADLKHEYEAETRFQLGYAMGQRAAESPATE